MQLYLGDYHDADFILDGFTNGFSLGVQKNPRVRPCSKILPVKEKLIVKIDDEVEKGRVVGPFRVPPMRALMISPVCAIPKDNSEKVRMILNLSDPKGYSVNDNIPATATTVSFCTVTEVVRWIRQDSPHSTCFLAKADLTDAYRLAPIVKKDWQFLGMRVGEDIYIDRCLPMGASSSCQTFQRISDAITWMAMTSCPVQCTIFNYLDDFLFVAKDQLICGQALEHFEKLCNDLGIPLSHHKTVRPTDRIIFLGLGIDTKDRVLFIPDKKARKTLVSLRLFLNHTKPRVGDWQCILGKLSHLTQVVAAGRPYLSSVYGSLRGIMSQHRHKRRHLNREAREDLGVWVDFLEELPPTRCFRMLDNTSASFSIYTDASTSIGFGCVFSKTWFAGNWPSRQWHGYNIAVLELYPVYAALHSWAEQLADSTVAIYTDNDSLVHMLNKLYTKDKKIRQLLKPVASLCLTHNIYILARHIPGKDNIGPDLLSRGKIPEFLARFPAMNKVSVEIPLPFRPENIDLS